MVEEGTRYSQSLPDGIIIGAKLCKWEGILEMHRFNATSEHYIDSKILTYTAKAQADLLRREVAGIVGTFAQEAYNNPRSRSTKGIRIIFNESASEAEMRAAANDLTARIESGKEVTFDYRMGTAWNAYTTVITALEKMAETGVVDTRVIGKSFHEQYSNFDREDKAIREREFKARIFTV